MNAHGKKIVVPVIVTVIMVLYYIVYFAFLIALLEGAWKYVLGIAPVAMAAVSVGVCIERIREIKEGEEDDLSQY